MIKKNINNRIISTIILFVPLIFLGSLKLNYEYIFNYFDGDYLGMKMFQRCFSYV